MPTVEFNWYGKPIPKARARKGAGGHWYTPEETTGYEESVQLAALFWKEHPVTDRPVRMELYIFIPMARTWTKKKKAEHIGQLHTQPPDLDNYIKAVADACQGIIYANDSQIVSVKATKVWSGDSGAGFRCRFDWED